MDNSAFSSPLVSDQSSANTAQPQPYPITPPPPKKSFNSLLFLPIILILLAVVGYEGYLYYQQTTLPAEEPVVRTRVTPVKKPLTLSIDSPSDGNLISSSQVLVKGKTLPNTSVAVYIDNDETIIDSDANGNFEGTVTVGEGINTLTVTAFGENGEEKSVVLDLVYDKAS